MAQVYYNNSLPTDFGIGIASPGDALIEELTVIHESIGTTPYVGVYLLASATSNDVVYTTNGRLRIEAQYTDGSNDNLRILSAPFNITLTSTSLWFRVPGPVNVNASDDALVNFGITEPTILVDLSNSSDRLALDPNKTLRSIAYYWTAD